MWCSEIEASKIVGDLDRTALDDLSRRFPRCRLEIANAITYGRMQRALLCSSHNGGRMHCCIRWIRKLSSMEAA